MTGAKAAIGDISRFSLVGLISTGVYFVVSNALIAADLLSPAQASVAGYGAGMLVSFFGQGQFTFRAGRSTLGQVARFLLLSFFGLMVSYWVLRLFTEAFGLAPVWGTLAVCVLIPLVNFVVMKYWVFKSEHKLAGPGRAPRV